MIAMTACVIAKADTDFMVTVLLDSGETRVKRFTDSGSALEWISLFN